MMLLMLMEKVFRFFLLKHWKNLIHFLLDGQIERKKEAMLFRTMIFGQISCPTCSKLKKKRLF
jgi:hypothetical protein